MYGRTWDHVEAVYRPFAGAGEPAKDTSGILGINKHGSISRGDLKYPGYLNSIALALPFRSLMAFEMGTQQGVGKKLSSQMQLKRAEIRLDTSPQLAGRFSVLLSLGLGLVYF